MAAALASPPSVLPTSDARAQTDQAPATEPATPKKENEIEAQENYARSYDRSSEQSPGMVGSSGRIDSPDHDLVTPLGDRVKGRKTQRDTYG
jgi:hypothetical protein